MIGIIVDTYSRYKHYIDHYKYNPKEYKLITRLEDVIGIKFDEVWELNYSWIDGIGSILEYLHIHGIKIIKKD